MDLRMRFNEDVVNYDRYRPTYCRELFEDIFSYAQLPAEAEVLEIGIGTGQGTLPFLEHGCRVTAIELGKDLAAYCREKFKAWEGFRVESQPFEEWQGTNSPLDQASNQAYDLVYSATAFHWIAPEMGYPKVKGLLKERGCAAFFWNIPVPARQEKGLYQEIQGIYEKYRPGSRKDGSWNAPQYSFCREALEKYGFRDVCGKVYQASRQFDPQGYIALLNTYSDHRAMAPANRAALEQDIKEVICRHGGKLTVYDTMELYLGRK